MNPHKLIATFVVATAIATHTTAAVPVAARGNCAVEPPKSIGNPLAAAGVAEVVTKPAFPLAQATVAKSYGFNGGAFQDYTELSAVPGEPVRNILPGRATAVTGESVAVRSGNIEITYFGISSLTKQGEYLQPGAVMGVVSGATVKLRGTRGGVPFDVIGTYFPERSHLVAEAARVEAARREYAASLVSRGGVVKASISNLTRAAVSSVPPDLDAAFEAAGRKYDVDSDLLRAVAWVESGFDVKAVSPKGAMGVMQLMPDTAKIRGVADPFDPAQNINGGAEYLRGLLDAYNGDLDLALAAYNAGPAAVERYKGVPPYAETRKYVAAAKRAYEAFKKTGGQKKGGNTNRR